MTAGRFIPPPPVEPVRNGTAETLARVQHFRGLHDALPDAHELDPVLSFLLGPVDDPRELLEQLGDELDQLWSLLTEDWSESDDLDELSGGDWARYSFTTYQQELDHRYGMTRDRLCLDIESAVWLARYVTAETRRTGKAVA